MEDNIIEYLELQEEFIDFEVYAKIINGEWKGFIAHNIPHMNYIHPFMFSQAIKVKDGLARYDSVTNTIIDL